MSITERQNQILDVIIEEYIESARPVSSQLLEEKHNFGIRPASIRLEMQKLTDEGYLMQPHTSAGRVPTDKGYRFFVDELLESSERQEELENEWLKDQIDDKVKFIQQLTKNLAESCDALVLSYLQEEKLFWKEGWEEVLREPEFDEKGYTANFADFLEDFEQNIQDLELGSEIKIFIGRENHIKKAKDFSIIISRCDFPNDEGIISLLGPKRMDYDKNISLMNSLAEVWQSQARRERR